MNTPPTACRTPGCKGYAVRSGLCSDCAGITVGDTATPPRISKHDYHRPWKHLYNTTRWRKLRDAILRRDPICTDGVVCEKRAASTVADHKIDHRGNLQLFYDPNNLRGVCKPCHDTKTGSSHGGGNREPSLPGLDSNGRVLDYFGQR